MYFALSRIKTNFLVLSFLIALLSIVSLSFGTINSSANSDNNLQQTQYQNSFFNNSQKSQIFGNLKEKKRLAFLTNNLPFTNGNGINQILGINNIGAALSNNNLAPGSTFVVNNSGDSNDANAGNGICADSNGNCTLRAAILEANALISDDTINFGISANDPNCTASGVCTITLTSGELAINNSSTSGKLVISNATGANRLLISGNNASRVFFVNAGANLTLDGVTIKNGNGNGTTQSGFNNIGGGIFSFGTSTLTLMNSTVSDNTAHSSVTAGGGSGGGICSFSSNTLTLINSIVSNNTAHGALIAGGGGIFSNGTTALINSTVIGNRTENNGDGGGIYSSTLTLVDSTVSGNTTQSSGGGISANTLTLTNSIVSGNTAQSSSSGGGGILTTTATLNNSIVKNNTTQNSGGGIYSNNSGTLTLNSSVISNNTAQYQGGGISTNGAAALTNSTVSGNTAPVGGGGIEHSGSTLAIINSTISGNTSRGASGIETNGILNLTGVTVTDNRSTFNCPACAGGILSRSEANLNNSIVAGNIAVNNSISPDFSGSVKATSSYNLIGTDTGMTGITNGTNGNQVGTQLNPIDPKLAPLNNNGGATETHALLPDSPAIDKGKSFNLIEDQRGFVRPIDIESYQNASGGDGADIGAFELDYLSSSISSLSPNSWGSSGVPFELTVNGSNFTSDSVVRWNGQDRATTFVSSTQLKAQILASDVQTAGQFPITVFNSGGVSNAVNFTVTNCSYSINPTSQNFIHIDANGTVNITTASGCAWTAQSNVNWITITSVSSSNGNGTVNFRVFANTGMARSGTITIGGQTFTITQTGGCSYSLSPTSANIPAHGGSGSFNVNTGAGCNWTSSSNDSWITVTGIHIGTGNGTLTYNFQPNTGMARTGTILVNGQTFTVNQASGCSYSLSSTSANISASGGTINFNVNTGTGCQWTVVNFSIWLVITSSNSGSGNGTVSLSVQANNLTIARSATLTVGDLVFTVNQSARTSVFSDFDGDGKADISVFRPENGAWYLLNSTSGFRAVGFGLGTDKLAPADYDGDLKTDIAVWRENPDDPGKANFYILRSSDNLFQEIQFGSTGDIPVSGDFNGDGRSDLAVYRKGANNTQSYFYYRPSAQPGVISVSIQWGLGDDKPVVADYDGDGKADIAVYRPSNGAWYIRRSRDGFFAIQFGVAEDKPVVGDYDGDGKADIAVYRPSNGAWYLLQSRDGFGAAQFGIATDKPVPADYDGDGKTDIAVFRDGTWYMQRSTAGFLGIQFGTATDKPIPNAYIP